VITSPQRPPSLITNFTSAGISPGDAVPDGTDAAELFDVEMDELAGLLAFIAIDRFGRLQGTELVQFKPTQNAADGGCETPVSAANLLAGPALAVQSLDLIDHHLGRQLPEPMRGRTVASALR
jgi:hypothetical protein